MPGMALRRPLTPSRVTRAFHRFRSLRSFKPASRFSPASPTAVSPSESDRSPFNAARLLTPSSVTFVPRRPRCRSFRHALSGFRSSPAAVTRGSATRTPGRRGRQRPGATGTCRHRIWGGETPASPRLLLPPPGKTPTSHLGDATASRTSPQGAGKPERPRRRASFGKGAPRSRVLPSRTCQARTMARLSAAPTSSRAPLKQRGRSEGFGLAPGFLPRHPSPDSPRLQRCLPIRL